VGGKKRREKNKKSSKQFFAGARCVGPTYKKIT
jgi:hypothetical protein